MVSNSLNQIINLVEKKLGLKHATKNPLIWKEILQERMLHHQVGTYEDYWNYLQTSSSEWQELIELIVVPETWFFRDQTVFDFIALLLKQSRFHTPFLRVLSLACSTGEEPYSLAMTLLDGGMPKQTFAIDAVDISQKALLKAQQGIYRPGAFRSNDLSFRDRYFKPLTRGYMIKDQVKTLVHFYHGNVIDPHFILPFYSYSLILCRNLLMYLNSETQRDVLNYIKTLLNSHGMLIVGSAETRMTLQAGFTPLYVSHTYAFILKQKASDWLPLMHFLTHHPL